MEFKTTPMSSRGYCPCRWHVLKDEADLEIKVIHIRMFLVGLPATGWHVFRISACRSPVGMYSGFLWIADHWFPSLARASFYLFFRSLSLGMHHRTVHDFLEKIIHLDAPCLFSYGYCKQETLHEMITHVCLPRHSLIMVLTMSRRTKWILSSPLIGVALLFSLQYFVVISILTMLAIWC